MDSEDREVFERAVRGSLGGNLVILFFVVVKLFLVSLLDGLIVFLPFAAISGFVSWLAGAGSPREVALMVGGAIGAMWAIFLFVGGVGRIVLAGWREMKREIATREVDPGEG